jgi:hypothetical protein
LRRGVDQRDSRIAELTKQLSAEAETHQKNLEGIREACRLVRDKCIVPRSQAEDTRYMAEVGRLSADLAVQRDESRQLQSQIDELVSRDATEVAGLDQKIAVINRKGERIYFRPGQLDYARVDMSKPGKRWFCTEQDAQAVGWRPTAR